MKPQAVSMSIVVRLTLLMALVLSTSPGAPTAAQQGPSGGAPEGSTSPEVLDRLGIARPEGVNPTEYSLQIAQRVQERIAAGGVGAFVPEGPQAGLPRNLSGNAALSAAVMTTVGGRNTQFDEVSLMADLDGREDLTADHSAKVVDFSGLFTDTEQMLTRVAISEHTRANGFNENIFYYGDSVGNVYVGADNDGNGTVDAVTVLNVPTMLNAFGNVNGDDQFVITGLAVNPVADLTSFPRVNGSFAPFTGQIGEILYVTFWDTGGGVRLSANNIVVKSGLLAFPIADVASPAFAPPGVQSNTGFPVTVGGSFGVAFSVFGYLAGATVDDDGSVYFQQVDLIQFTGANIVKITSVDSATNQDRSLATNGFMTITTLNPSQGVYGTISGPINQISRVTNFSGTSTTWGNIAALAAGPDNVLYAALARSLVTTDDASTQASEGLFTNPAALGATPAMIVSFADAAGAFDTCSAPATGFSGSIPIANGIADVAQSGLTLAPGVNNFRVFAMGGGPDARGTIVGATVTDTLKLEFQVDYTIYSGIAVDEEKEVYLISGGTPAGVGRDPSPTLGEILDFPDHFPNDRRADYIDLRGNAPPNPPVSGGNVGDGDSDRFDHIFWPAPIDQITATPTGVAGLARGFLLYLNRTHNGTGPTNLPNGSTQGDDDTSGPLSFEEFDPSHQVAGGDDQNPPFRGDDSDGSANPTLVGPLLGGFEFAFGGPVGSITNTIWNAFYLNSNGSVTFGVGDTDNTPTITETVTGGPRIAASWTDLNLASRSAFTNTFPVQALGFAGVNHFVVRWINTPEFNKENCSSSNTFSIGLLDDGTGRDENASQPLNPANPIGNNAVPFDLQEGPTDLRFTPDPVSGQLFGNPARPDKSGQFCLDYGRMDLIGISSRQVLSGLSGGGQISVPAGLSETNLSEAARAADNALPTFPGLLSNNDSSRTVYELFNSGANAQLTFPGGITTVVTATVDLDLRFEGNDPLLSKQVNQVDPNRGTVCFFNLNLNPSIYLPLAVKSP